MKLSASNIAWAPERDDEMCAFLREQGFDGLEIAPTRVFPESPYDRLEEAGEFARRLQAQYGLSVSSMQSIWYGKNANLFGADGERAELAAYTRKAVDFAAAMNCVNLVFGCPKNRNIPEQRSLKSAFETAAAFFAEICDYAGKRNVVIALEANPPIYGTNFINTTAEAFEFCRASRAPVLKVNADVGTMVYQEESARLLYENLDMISHIHISEPYLMPIKERNLHAEIKNLLANKFRGFVSLEMSGKNDFELVKRAVEYVRRRFK